MNNITSKQLYLIFWSVLIIISIAGVIYGFVFMGEKEETDNQQVENNNQSSNRSAVPASTRVNGVTIYNEQLELLDSIHTAISYVGCGSMTDVYSDKECFQDSQQIGVQCQQGKIDDWFRCVTAKVQNTTALQDIERVKNRIFEINNTLITAQGSTLHEVLYEYHILKNELFTLQGTTSCNIDVNNQIIINKCNEKPEQKKDECIININNILQECFNSQLSQKQLNRMKYIRNKIQETQSLIY